MISPRMSLKNMNLDDYVISAQEKSQGRPRLGKLVPVSKTELWLHTGEAVNLYTGSYLTEKGKGQGSVGCEQACTQISALFFSNRVANPYVDQTLIYLERKLASVMQSLDQRINNIRRQMSESAESGFVLQEVESTKPKCFQIDFNCPYAIQYTHLVHKFDDYNRLLFALLFQGALTRDQANKQRKEIQTCMRTLFYDTHVQSKFLFKDGFNKKLHYGNWLAADDAMIQTFAKIAAAGYQVIEDDILTRKTQPKFSVGNPTGFSEADIKKLLDVNNKIRLSVQALEQSEAKNV